jgi:hypothetical protein
MSQAYLAMNAGGRKVEILLASMDYDEEQRGHGWLNKTRNPSFFQLNTLAEMMGEDAGNFLSLCLWSLRGLTTSKTS